MNKVEDEIKIFKSDTRESIFNASTKQKKNTADISETNTKLELLTEEVKRINRHMMREYESKEVVKRLTERVDKLSSMESIAYLSDVLLPRCNEMYYKMDEFLKDNETMK